MKTPTVLVVDDEAMVRRCVMLALQPAGFHVLLAEDIAEAEAICKDHPGPIDVLVMDVILGTSHGFDGVPCLASHRAEMKVIYMSGYPGQLLFESQGIHAQFLSKPFMPHELVAAVRQALGQDGGQPPEPAGTSPSLKENPS